jgi:hypothetical protein
MNMQEEPIDWELIQAENEALQKAMDERKKDPKNLLDSLLFGLG